jgi:hypothetical protein
MAFRNKYLVINIFLLYKDIMILSSTELSSHRQRLRKLLDKIEKQAFCCAYSDPLIQGVAGEVFRRCGKKNCKCIHDADRHGPYLIIQLYENKKQRQVALKKEQKELWQQAKNYQSQINNLLELKKTYSELLDEIETILKKRLVKWSDAVCEKKK